MARFKLSKNAVVVFSSLAAFSAGMVPMGVVMLENHYEQAQLESGEINTTVLLNHSLFTHAKKWLALIIPQLNVSEVARTFLEIKFTAFQESLEKLVEATDFNILSNEQLHALLSENLNNTVRDYIADAQRAGVSPAFIAEFSKWHQRVVDILVRSIEDNVFSVIYSSQNAKIYAILTAYDSALGATIEDVEKTLEASGK